MIIGIHLTHLLRLQSQMKSPNVKANKPHFIQLILVTHSEKVQRQYLCRMAPSSSALLDIVIAANVSVEIKVFT